MVILEVELVVAVMNTGGASGAIIMNETKYFINILF